MHTRVTALLAAVLSLAACATTGKHAGYISASDVATAVDARAPITVTVVYPRDFPISGAFDIYQEDRRVGVVAPGEYLSWQTDVPADGRLFVLAKGNTLGNQGDLVILRPTAGEDAFLQVDVTVGLANPVTRLVIVDVEEGLAFVSQAADDRGKKWRG